MTRTVAQQRSPFNLHMFLPSIILQAVCLILPYAAWLLKKVKTIYSIKYFNIFYTVYRTSRTVLNRSNPFGGKTWNRSEPFLFILLQIGNSSRTVLNRSEPFLSLLARRTVLNRSPGLRLLHTRTVLNRSDKAYFSTYLSIHT